MNKKKPPRALFATEKCQKPFKWKIYSRSRLSFAFASFFYRKEDDNEKERKKGKRAEEIFPVINNLNMIGQPEDDNERSERLRRQKSPRRKLMKKERGKALIRGKVFMDFFWCVRETTRRAVRREKVNFA